MNPEPSGPAPDRSSTRTGEPSRAWAAAGALAAGTAVALGAFGAHALEGVLSSARAATFETAVRYQFLHGVALLALDASRVAGATPLRAFRWAAPAIAWGTFVFSGSLYALVATDRGAFGAVAPIGGGLLLVGWAAWAWGLARRPHG